MSRTAKITAVLITACFICTHTTVYAGDKEWATAGKILTGIAGLGILANIAASGRGRHYYAPEYCRSYPASVPRAIPAGVWIPGHYEYRTERVWIAEQLKEKWIPARHRWVRTRFGWQQICVREGYYRRKPVPGHYRNRQVQVWIPGHWS